MGAAYGWQWFYEAAVLETDVHKVQEHIGKAERAIQERLSESSPPIIDAAEWQAIGNTLAALAVLKAQSANCGTNNRHHQAPTQQEQADGPA